MRKFSWIICQKFNQIFCKKVKTCKSEKGFLACLLFFKVECHWHGDKYSPNALIIFIFEQTIDPTTCSWFVGDFYSSSFCKCFQKNVVSIKQTDNQELFHIVFDFWNSYKNFWCAQFFIYIHISHKQCSET